MVTMPLYDRCYLGAQAATGGYGEPRAGYTYSDTSTRCLVIDPGPAEVGAGLQLPADAVKIAFRVDSGVVAASRVKVTRRIRQTLGTAEEYVVTGAPRRVRGRLVAVCQRTSTRSAE